MRKKEPKLESSDEDQQFTLEPELKEGFLFAIP